MFINFHKVKVKRSIKEALQQKLSKGVRLRECVIELINDVCIRLESAQNCYFQAFTTIHCDIRKL